MGLLPNQYTLPFNFLDPQILNIILFFLFKFKFEIIYLPH